MTTIKSSDSPKQPLRQTSRKLTKKWPSSGTPIKIPTTVKRQSKNSEKSRKPTKTYLTPRRERHMTNMVSKGPRLPTSATSISTKPMTSSLIFLPITLLTTMMMTSSVASSIAGRTEVVVIIVDLEGLEDLAEEALGRYLITTLSSAVTVEASLPPLSHQVSEEV